MTEQAIPLRLQHLNDEPVYEDTLGHHSLAKQLGDRIVCCTPPYVVGVQGSWGSGKTSFLRKVWACLGGETDQREESLQRWFGAGAGKRDDGTASLVCRSSSTKRGSSPTSPSIRRSACSAS